VDEQTGRLRFAESANPEIEKHLHRMIAKVQDDIERLSFNTAIAAMIEFNNAAIKAGGLSRDQIERYAIALSPFAPHIAEELWSLWGMKESIAVARGRGVDAAMLRDDQIDLPVGGRGRVRGKTPVPANADEQSVQAAAIAEPKIAELLKGKTVRKVVV